MTYHSRKILSKTCPVIAPHFGVNAGQPLGNYGTRPVITPRCFLPIGVKMGHQNILRYINMKSVNNSSFLSLNEIFYVIFQGFVSFSKFQKGFKQSARSGKTKNNFLFKM